MKQQAFLDAYLLDPNATQAAIKAGYTTRSAASSGHRLLRNREIATALIAARTKRVEQAEVTTTWVLARLVDNATHAYEEKEYYASTKALELIGKHLGMFIERHQVTFSEEERVNRLADLFAQVRGAQPTLTN